VRPRIGTHRTIGTFEEENITTMQMSQSFTKQNADHCNLLMENVRSNSLHIWPFIKTLNCDLCVNGFVRPTLRLLYSNHCETKIAFAGHPTVIELAQHMWVAVSQYLINQWTFTWQIAGFLGATGCVLQ